MIPKHVNLWEQPDLFSTPSSRWRAQCCLSLLQGQPTLIVDENCRFTHFVCYSLSRFVLFNHGSAFTRSCEKHEQVVIFFLLLLSAATATESKHTRSHVSSASRADHVFLPPIRWFEQDYKSNRGRGEGQQEWTTIETYTGNTHP